MYNLTGLSCGKPDTKVWHEGQRNRQTARQPPVRQLTRIPQFVASASLREDHCTW